MISSSRPWPYRSACCSAPAGRDQNIAQTALLPVGKGEDVGGRGFATKPAVRPPQRGVGGDHDGELPAAGKFSPDASDKLSKLTLVETDFPLPVVVPRRVVVWGGRHSTRARMKLGGRFRLPRNLALWNRSADGQYLLPVCLGRTFHRLERYAARARGERHRSRRNR